MESEQRGRSLDLVVFVLLVVVCFTPAVRSRKLEGGLAEEQNYYSPDPHSATPPPSNCGTPSRGRGGGSHGAPSHRPPQTPPSQGGGGYYAPPLVPETPLSPIIVPPVTPSPLVPLAPPTPTLPVIPTPPATPFLPIDPNIFPFTCDYWRTHPAAIWGLIGYWCTIGQLFGFPSAPSLGTWNPSLTGALANTRRDGIGALYREGTASLLNSMANRGFVFSTQQVKEAFNAAVVSDKAAAAQARVFKSANEGHLKHA